MLSIQKAFKLHLRQARAAPATVRNYTSDLSLFLAWLTIESKKSRRPVVLSPASLSLLITPKTIRKYQMYLVGNQVPSTTIKRRLSSLRRWGDQVVKSGWLRENPFITANYIRYPREKRDITQADILRKFRLSLEKETANPGTIRNYLSDIRHFLSWVGSQ